MPLFRQQSKADPVVPFLPPHRQQQELSEGERWFRDKMERHRLERAAAEKARVEAAAVTAKLEATALADAARTGKRSYRRGGHRPFAAAKPGASIAALARRTRAQDKRRGLDPDP